MERVAITDIPGLDPGSSFFVMLRFLHSEELTPVVTAFSVSILPPQPVSAQPSTSRRSCQEQDAKNADDCHFFHAQIHVVHPQNGATVAYLLSDKVRRGFTSGLITSVIGFDLTLDLPEVKHESDKRV